METEYLNNNNNNNNNNQSIFFIYFQKRPLLTGKQAYLFIWSDRSRKTTYRTFVFNEVNRLIFRGKKLVRFRTKNKK